ncbi:type II toxin-antitoxin system HicA family toxin [Treponema sp. OMZ 787]|nr:type II toxin-antitoxin system HicA family toxin [Treponema sp. OMZ 787]
MHPSREVIKILQNDGWYEVEVVGSHHQFKHETKITFFLSCNIHL